MKKAVITSLFVLKASLCSAITKPSFLINAGDPEEIVESWLTAVIKYPSWVAVAAGPLCFLIGFLLLNWLGYGPQRTVKKIFVTGVILLVVGIIGLNMVY